MKGVLVVALVACAPGDRPRSHAAGGVRHDGGTLHVATAEHVTTLDPALAGDEVSLYVVHALYDTLVDYGPALEPVPGLATWTISPDERVYTFHLDDGAAYSDGTPVAPADVAYALARAKDTPNAGYVDAIAAVDTGARDVVVHLTAPSPTFLYVMAMPFSTPQRAGSALGTGAFQLAGWGADRIELRRNPHARVHAHLDAIELREWVDPDAAFLRFDRGELDLVDHLAIHDAQAFLAAPAWRPFVKQATQLATFGWRMDTRERPFDDRRVRQALNLADNKAHVVKLLGGTATIAHGMLPPGVLGYSERAPYACQPGAARDLLARAGYPDGFDVALVTYQGDEPEKLAASFQADLAAVGVRATIDVRSFAEFAAGDRAPPHALWLGAWGGDSPDPTSFVDAQFRSGQAANNTGYANPALDALLDRAATERDREARRLMYREADGILHDDAPWVWEYHRTTTEVVQPYVQDYAIHPIFVRDFSSIWLDREEP